MPKAPLPGGKGSGKGSSSGSGGHTAEDDEAHFLWAESMQESGGNYGAISGDGALGRWQVMPQNLYGWARQCGMTPVSPSEFLANHAYQDQLVTCILGGYYKKYGPQGAAAMWYSGQSNPGETYGDPPVYQYVEDVMNFYRQAGGVAGTAGQSGGFEITLSNPPGPGTDSWGGYIVEATNNFGKIHTVLTNHGNTISALLREHEEH